MLHPSRPTNSVRSHMVMYDSQIAINTSSDSNYIQQMVDRVFFQHNIIRAHNLRSVYFFALFVNFVDNFFRSILRAHKTAILLYSSKQLIKKCWVNVIGIRSLLA